ncbi:MAG TPA: hypothetical protein VJ958_05220 [Atribacterota bacterium]|nr:hypothetical protein [Atribacterota bacterium]
MYITKNRQKINWKQLSIFCLTIVITAFLINGCARWPEEPNGGGGAGEKQLIVKVEINEEGTVNTDEGNYYIVFDTNKDASFPPDDDVDNWEDGYYYIKLDDFGFSFGQVGDSEGIYSGTDSEKYFQVTISLADLGNPEGIHMNVITTDTDNETYDALDTDFYINTSLLFPKTETDSLEDSTGGPDFDIAQVTTTILTP